MVWPSRRMVIESATRAISLSLCEMMMLVMPSALSSRMRSSSLVLSSSLSAAVGSSRISSLTFLASALAISTSCCLPTPRSTMRRCGLSRSPTRASRALAWVLVSFQLMTPRLLVLVAQEQVLRDRQVAHQRELLVDDDDAAFLAGLDVLEVARLAVEEDLAVVVAVRIDAAEHLHQRRLAGAVLATDRMDLAAADREVDVVEREDTRELLGDGPHVQDRVVDHAGQPSSRAGGAPSGGGGRLPSAASGW